MGYESNRTSAYEPIESDDILTVGQKASDDSKVQYCITALEIEKDARKASI